MYKIYNVISGKICQTPSFLDQASTREHINLFYKYIDKDCEDADPTLFDILKTS